MVFKVPLDKTKNSTDQPSVTFSEILKTPDGYFCMKSGKDKRITIDENNRSTSNQLNSNIDDDDLYLSSLNANLKNLSINNNNSNNNKSGKVKEEKKVKTSTTTTTSTSTTTGGKERYLIDSSKGITGGKVGQVFFVTKEGASIDVDDNDSNGGVEGIDNRQVFAVKKQYISSPANKRNKAYRELIILNHIKKLLDQRKCCNYINIVEWYKSSPFPVQEQKGNSSNNNGKNVDVDWVNWDVDKTRQPDTRRSYRNQLRGEQYMNFIMEYADLKSLNHYKTNNVITLTKYQSMLFQVLYALAVGQAELEFMHNDLHSGNILIQSLPKNAKYITYRDSQQRWFVGEFMIKLCDFGLSRITLPEELKDDSSDEESNNNNNSNNISSSIRNNSIHSDKKVIYNPKNPQSKHFLFFADGVSLNRSLGSIRIADIAEHPLKKKQLSDLKKRIPNVEPQILLHHGFFDSLLVKPADATIDNCIRFSTDGIINDNEDKEYFTTNNSKPEVIQQETNNDNNSNDDSTSDESREIMSSFESSQDDDDNDEEIDSQDGSDTITTSLEQVKISTPKNIFKTPVKTATPKYILSPYIPKILPKSNLPLPNYVSLSKMRRRKMKDLVQVKLEEDYLIDSDTDNDNNNNNKSKEETTVDPTIEPTIDTTISVPTKVPKQRKKKMSVNERLQLEGKNIVKRLINPS